MKLITKIEPEKATSAYLLTQLPESKDEQFTLQQFKQIIKQEMLQEMRKRIENIDTFYN